MRRVIAALTATCVFVYCQGCYTLKKDSTTEVGVLDKKREIKHENTRQMVAVSYDRESEINLDVDNVEDVVVYEKKEIEYERCKEYTSGDLFFVDGQGNLKDKSLGGMIGYLIIDVPIAILLIPTVPFMLFLNGCKKHTTWSDWTVVTRDAVVVSKYGGEAKLTITPSSACVSVDPQEVYLKNGAGVSRVNFTYPCLPERAASEIPAKSPLDLALMVSVGDAKTQNLIKIHDVQPYLDNLILSLFDFHKFPVVERDSLHALDGAQVVIALRGDIDIEGYIEKVSELDAKLKGYLSEHVKKKHPNILRRGTMTLNTDKDGFFVFATPKGGNVTFDRFQVFHDKYGNFEIRNVIVSPSGIDLGKGPEKVVYVTKN